MVEFCLEVLSGRGLSSLLTASYIYNNFFDLIVWSELAYNLLIFVSGSTGLSELS